MVVYLNCKYLNSKNLAHIFIIKTSIIHFHLSDFISKILILVKNTQPIIFILFHLTNSLPEIQWFKFNRIFNLSHPGTAGIAVEY